MGTLAGATRRAILTTAGSEGNVSPFISIGRELSRRGLDVYLITHPSVARRFRGAPIHFVAMDNEDEYQEFLREGELLNHTSTIAKFFRKYFLANASREIAAIGDLYSQGQTILIGSEMPGISARIASERFGIPWISIILAPGFLSTRNLFMELLSTALADDIQQIRDRLSLPKNESWKEKWHSEIASLALWPAWFSDAVPPDVRCLNFVWEDAHMEIAGDSFDGNDFILITGGTGYFASASFFATAVEACGKTGMDSLLVCANPDLLPASLPRNMKHLDAVPSLAALMHRASLVVNHGGMGTVGQAIAAGRPQIVLASGGDRPEIARHVQRLGAGVAVPKPRWSSDFIADLIRRTVSDEGMRRRCVELSALVQERGHIAACDIIGSCIESLAAPEHAHAATQGESGRSGDIK